MKTNKKVCSMRDLQNGALTLKERQIRDRSLRKEKGKEKDSSAEKITNLSLSDSNINNRRRVILGEAKKMLKMGKKLGLRVRGDEREVLEEVMNIERV